MDSDPAGAVGRRVAGRYRIESALGAGGMGAVYAVIDESSGARLALKRLHPNLATGHENVIALFKREFYTLEQLAHPLIVEAYEYGVDAGAPFFTMELLPGQDLARCAPLPWREICRVLRDIASALAMLHSRGLVYRDLSARNVRLDRDGKPKLFDFGALASRDARHPKVIGTPPYVAPEALHGQPLDARTDLYALGALAYYLLCGRHAYPATRLAQLRDFWRSAPRAPSALGVDSPPALDALVLSLLAVDPRARPRQAAEVIDRLGALADLEPMPAELAARAYLNRPTLVGREREMLVVRKQVMRMLRGRGAALCIEAPSGMGRTRLLQELALEAKLAGVGVLHAEARPGAGHYATLRALADQLLSTFADVAIATAAPHARELSAVLPQLGERLGEHLEPPAPRAEREDAPVDADERWARTQTALRQWLEAIARARPLLIAVDDLHSCDAASAGVLAALALGAPQRRLVVAATLLERADAGPASAACASFREHARALGLQPLELHETTELYRRVFGDAPYLPELASWADGLARGNPQHCMLLAQDLVDRGVIRYAEGVWVLPRDLAQQALPTSLAQAFEQRLAGLSEAARDVAEVLCVAGEPVAAFACVAFCAERDEASVFRALDELVAAELLLAGGDRYAFRELAAQQAIDRGIDEVRRRACHRRIGMALLAREPAEPRERLRAAFHLLRGGQDAEGSDLLVATVPHLQDLPRDIGERGIEACELALVACERLGRPAAQAVQIRLALLTCAFFFDHELLDHALPALERLEQDSGMALVAQQDPSRSLVERVLAAMGQANERYQALPEHERVFDPVTSAVELGKALLTVQAIYSTQYDVERARACCARFEPLAALTPLAKLCHDAALSAVDALVGRVEPALALQRSVIERTQALLEQTPAGPDALRLEHLLASIAYVVGLRLLFTDPHETLRLADLVDRVASARHKPGAAQLRVIAHTLMGDVQAAERYQMELEDRLVRFRTHGSSGVDLSYRIRASALAGDLLSLKAASRDAEALSARRPGYQPFVHLARGHSYRLRAKHEEALDEFEAAARLARPGAHQAWAEAISNAVQALVDLGRLGEARGCIELARSANQEHELGGTLDEQLLPVLAELDAREGNPEAATRRLQQALDDATAQGYPLLVRGMLRSGLLRIALIAGDRAAFARDAAALRALYRETDNRALHAAHDRLMDAARAAGLLEEHEAAARPLAGVDAERVKVATALSACTDPGARAQCALTLLAEDLHAPAGYLFALRQRRLEVLAGPPGRPDPPPEMVEVLERYLSAELTQEEEATATSLGAPSESATRTFTDGRSYRPVVLRTLDDGQPVIVGVAAMEVSVEQPVQPSWGLISALGEHLMRAGDV